MVTTLISQPAIGRARSVEASIVSGAPVCAAAASPATAVFSAPASFHALTTATPNMWLGGAVQGDGSGSKYASKRIPPGRLRTET